jgi:acetyl-CoA C-acetyltransferase
LAGLSSVADASRRIRTGEGEAYIVGGGDSMSQAPHASVIRDGVARPASVELVDTMVKDGLWCSLGNEGMGELAERSNQALGIHREVQDEIALRSQKLAAAATDRGRLALEIVPINSSQAHLAEDEGIRPGVSLEKLERLAPAFASHGTITAGNASQMSDGSSVGALTSFAYSEKVGRAPLARIIALAEVAGPDSSLHLKPAAAIEAALERAGLSLANVDLFEINEAFAGVVEASRRELSIPLDVVNVNGGAIALGHPLGGSGFRLLLTLAHELEQRQSQFGVAALCGGGGQGIAIVIERMGS